MTFRRQSVATLTRLDDALRLLRDGVEPVPPRHVPLAEALGCMAADMPPGRAWPPRHLATTDGWALRSSDIVGASTYSPVLLPVAPVWVEAGAALPDGCDCVLDVDRVTQAGPMFQAVSEAAPGEGVRRAGEDISVVTAIVAAGRRIGARDLALARTLGLERLAVRRPRVHILDVGARDGRAITTPLMAESVRGEGAEVVVTVAAARDPDAIIDAIDNISVEQPCDLLLLIGGTGSGREDAAVIALAARGEVVAHGLALRPGRTAALARVGQIPVVAVPGAPADALAVWWCVVAPLLHHLSGAGARPSLPLPLARKVASTVGLAEIVMLARHDAGWMPLAIGDIPLEQLARADAWLCVPDDSEGYAAGTLIDARWLSR
jgi:molybdopterin biosynthesis enzyme